MADLKALLERYRAARKALIANRSPEVMDSDLAWHAWIAREHTLRAECRSAEVELLVAAETAIEDGTLAERSA